MNLAQKKEGSVHNREEPYLSVVVLCYRSGESIVPFLNQMETELQAGGVYDYELVLVGNYIPNTGDTTPKIVRDLAVSNSRVRPVTLEKRGMMGWDMRTGLEAARGRAVAIIDGDGQMPSKDVVRLYRVLQSGEFDLVKTYRKVRLDGAYRKLTSFCYNAIFRILFPGVPLRDINAKPKIMTHLAYNKMRLTSSDWFIDAEIMLEATRLNLNIAEVPTTFYKNEWRGSFVKVSTIFEFLRNLIQYRFKYWFR